MPTSMHRNHLAGFSCSSDVRLMKFPYDTELDEIARMLGVKQTPSRILNLVLFTVKVNGIRHIKCCELLTYGYVGLPH